MTFAGIVAQEIGREMAKRGVPLTCHVNPEQNEQRVHAWRMRYERVTDEQTRLAAHVAGARVRFGWWIRFLTRERKVEPVSNVMPIRKSA